MGSLIRHLCNWILFYLFHDLRLDLLLDIRRWFGKWLLLLVLYNASLVVFEMCYPLCGKWGIQLEVWLCIEMFGEQIKARGGGGRCA